jgi:endo-1,4-beta-D-glucanase Y/4-amino-4-deoxy-L-arabinose transferase-like glycosyltransferase
MKLKIKNSIQLKFYNLVNKIKSIDRLELLFFLIIIGLIFYTHSLNMFNYPAQEDDEGVYMSQAWAITHLNKLAPYTYWYDHAPLGWMILGLISILMGGYNTFGDSISTGRVIMLMMHIFSSIIIIFTTKKMTNNVWAGYLAAIVFSLLPLISYFQRRVLLDNILVFFLSLSFYAVIDKKITIRKSIYSGLLLGIAFLCKESAIFFVPGIIYIVYRGLSKDQKFLGIVSWLGFFISTVALYIVLAVTKTELFPSNDKVSLIGTLEFQASRGSGLKFWMENSEIRQNMSSWLSNDIASYYTLITILIIGFILSFINYKNKYWNAVTILIFGYLAFLLRGKTVIEFYIIPMGYLSALISGLIFQEINLVFQSMTKEKQYFNLFNKSFVSLVIILSLVLQFNINSKAFSKDEVSPSKNMVNWIRQNIPKDSKLVIGCNLYGDFHYPSDKNLVYPDADWFWKSDRDPDIRIKKYKNNPENIDYLLGIVGPGFSDSDLTFLYSAFQESKEIKKFSNTYTETSLYKIVKDKPKILQNTWNNYKKKYLKNDYISTNDNYLTSGDQKYGIMLSILNDDFESFNKIRNFTINNFQKRNTDKLLVSKIVNKNSTTVVLDSNTSTDADIDIAYSLILASQKWGIPEFADEAKTIIQDLWKYRVVSINDKLVLLPNDSNIKNGNELINLAYLSPAQYKIFKTIDPTNNWEALASDSYKIVNEVLNNYKLLPNWIKYDYNSKSFQDASDVKGPGSNQFNSEVANYYTRVNLDMLLFKNYNESKFILDKNLEFFTSEFRSNKTISSIYGTNGKSLNSKESTAMYSGILSLFSFGESKLKGEIWRTKFIDRIDMDEQTFDTKNLSFEDRSIGPIAFAIKEGSMKELEQYKSLIK